MSTTVPAPSGTPQADQADADQTKLRILAAALEEFSEKGISGARVDSIAERAKANKRMLYYYFGSKEGLFKAVLRHRLTERPRDEDTAADITELPPASAAHLRALADRMATAPEYVRLLMWEALERGTDVETEDETSRRDAYRRWIERIREAQQTGALPQVDPAQLVSAEVALAIFPYAFPQLARLITGRDPHGPKAVAAHKKFLGWLGDTLSESEERPSP